MAERPQQRRLPLFAILLVCLGIILLLQNLGVLSWGLWWSLWRYWPALLILIGVNIIFGRRYPLLAAGLVLAIICAVVATAYFHGAARASASGSFSEPLAGLIRAEVTIEFGAGDLTVGSLPATSDKLVEGDFQRRGSREELVRQLDVEEGVGKLLLKLPKARWTPFGGSSESLRLYLSRQIPLELRIKIGASDASLELTGLTVSSLHVDVGASRATIRLPRSGETDAFIKAGAAQLTIAIPQGVAARIKSQGGLTHFTIDQKRFPKSGEYFLSPDFSTAQDRVDLVVESGVGLVRVE